MARVSSRAAYFLVSFFIFFGGIYIEFHYRVTESIPLFSDYYERLEEIEKAERFITMARGSIELWQRDYYGFSDVIMRPTNLNTTTELKEILNYSELINLNKLSKGWRIHLGYFRTYVYFLDMYYSCTEASFEDAKRELMNVIELVQDSKLDRKSRFWMQRVSMVSNLNSLEAFMFALRYQQKGDNDRNTINYAINALKRLGVKERLLVMNVPNDRLLGPVFYMAYPEEKPQVEQ